MKIIIFITITILASSNLHAVEKCKDLPGFKKVGKDSIDYLKCLANKGKKEFKGEGKLKLNTDSKLTDWLKKQ